MLFSAVHGFLFYSKVSEIFNKNVKNYGNCGRDHVNLDVITSEASNSHREWRERQLSQRVFCDFYSSL